MNAPEASVVIQSVDSRVLGEDYFGWTETSTTWTYQVGSDVVKTKDYEVIPTDQLKAVQAYIESLKSVDDRKPLDNTAGAVRAADLQLATAKKLQFTDKGYTQNQIRRATVKGVLGGAASGTAVGTVTTVLDHAAHKEYHHAEDVVGAALGIFILVACLRPALQRKKEGLEYHRKQIGNLLLIRDFEEARAESTSGLPKVHYK